MKSNEVILKISHLSKFFGDNEVLKDISTDVTKGEVVVIIGPSGSGKSTFLRCLNYLETPTSGEINFKGQILSPKSKEHELDLYRSKIGMVFQSFNLFPHLTVLENITMAPIHVCKVSKAEAQSRAEDLLNSVGLIEKLHAYPRDLSGGQQQRVAIARALAMKPDIMLF
jgi:ABC-type polar amino acid transport system ATPase subunit